MAASGSSSPREGAEPTFAGDPETLAMMSRIETSLFDAQDRLVHVGRFALDRVLGAGGMGVVHLAHDDVLDRRVAIKLIRGERVPSEELRARLLREARAMARLSHANVVQVYEAGEHDGQVFVAMELVEGRTLARWLDAEAATRPWRERLAVLVAAGQGLAAAHRAGLVHRDFKPDNVLLNERGEAKVADFGLAGVTVDVAPPSSMPSDVDSLTVTGSLVGTPRYMAPEQLVGRAADARSDQFAFCIVAYEALVGQRPFGGDTFVELSANVIAGAVRPVPRACPTPRWLLAIVERGLDPDPAQRWPSMDALLAAMSARRGRASTIALLGLLAGAPALALAMPRDEPAPPGCDRAREELAGVWDSTRREQTAEAFRGSAKPWAADTFARVAPVLDGYAATWAEAELGACTLAQAGDPTAAPRLACLDHARHELQFVTDDLVVGEPHSLVYAVELVGALPGLVRCKDPEDAALDVGSLDDPDLRAIFEGLAQAKVLVHTRRLAEADARLIEIQTGAAAYRRDVLEGHALLLRSKAALLGAAWDRAHEHAAQALALAERAERDEIAILAWLSLFYASYERADYDRAAFELDRAESIAGAGADAEMRGQLMQARAQLLGATKRRSEAVVEYRRALEALRAVDPEHPLIADVLSDMAEVLLLSGEQEEAIAATETSLRMRARKLGDSHPTMVLALGTAANHYVAAGRFEDALQANQRALALAKLYPEQRPEFIPGLAALIAQNLVSLGRFDEAEQMLEHAEDLASRRGQPARGVLGYIGLSLGNLHLDRREFALAIPRYETALSNVTDRWENRAIVAANLAYALASLGRIEEALARSAEAKAAIADMATDAPLRVGIEIYDGEVQRLAGKNDEARAIFLRVLPVLERIEVDPSLRFMAYFGAAQVESDRELALGDAEQAAEALTRIPNAQWQRAALATWRARYDDRARHVRGRG
ncbi:MAG TPA: serine/threonine-protein kinase [Nannocystaceae bacterium]|nr:serine/threonine-protein kinase [Nannocystaceae bacterium]